MADAVINGDTGELETAAEAVRRFAALEAEITRCDQVLDSIKASLKEANGKREEAVAALRKACRGARPLPLIDGQAGPPAS